ncbi:hypothetical protein [Hymenobacter siberiensis]|nr:hypothetical protein [Hymenobacter siberiensis]
MVELARQASFRYFYNDAGGPEIRGKPLPHPKNQHNAGVYGVGYK